MPEKKTTKTTTKKTEKLARRAATLPRVGASPVLGRSSPRSRAKAATSEGLVAPSRDRASARPRRASAPAAGLAVAGLAGAGLAAAEAPRAHRGHRRAKVGRVVSAKTPKTVIVEIERLREHPLYKKTIRVRKKFPAHDANGDVKAGDLVRIQESRPFSATKRWQVVEVISRAGEAYAAAPEAAEIESALEEAEGVKELLAKPEREAVAVATEGAEGEGEDDGTKAGSPRRVPSGGSEGQ